MRNKLLLAISSILMFSTGWLGISGLPLLGAFVPLMLISRSYGSSRGEMWKTYLWSAAVMGLWNIINVWWVWCAAPSGVIASTIISMTLFAGVFTLYHYVSKRAGKSLAYAILVCGWIAAENLYLKGEISFPWLMLGNGFANDIWAVQWYEFTGAFGGSLWALVANCLIFEAVTSLRRRRFVILSAVWIAVPAAVSLAMWLTYKEPAGEKLKVTAVQPDFGVYPVMVKFSMPRAEQDSIMLSLIGQAPADVDIIVLPETAIGEGEIIWEPNFMFSNSVRNFAENVASNHPSAQLIVGAMTYKLYPDERSASPTARFNGNLRYDVFNTALAVDGLGDVATHHKQMLVIGAEKMPYMKLLKPLESLIVNLGGTTGQLGRDGRIGVFRHTSPQHPMGFTSAAAICYESIYGEHFTKFVDKGAQVMFVITNDGWWGDTWGYRHHFSYARLRAVETRRYVVRSANTGISGFIDQRGDVLGKLGWEQRGTLTDEVRCNNEKTFYVRHGDWIARLSVMVFLLGILYYAAYRIKRKHLLVK